MMRIPWNQVVETQMHVLCRMELHVIIRGPCINTVQIRLHMRAIWKIINITRNNFVSSAKEREGDESELEISFMKTMNNGPSILPWGTPDNTGRRGGFTESNSDQLLSISQIRMEPFPKITCDPKWFKLYQKCAVMYTVKGFSDVEVNNIHWPIVVKSIICKIHK